MNDRLSAVSRVPVSPPSDSANASRDVKADRHRALREDMGEIRETKGGKIRGAAARGYADHGGVRRF